ncbi:MAG: MarR family transcriptional regulator [Polyangia bacterium]
MSTQATQATRSRRRPRSTDSTFTPNESMGYLINVAGRLFSRALNARLLKHGVSIGQWPILMFLFEKEGLSQQEISQHIGLEESTLARTIERMERDGLVERLRSAIDRRRVELTLTPRARALRRSLRSCAIAVNETAMAGLSDNAMERLLQGLAHMRARLEEDLGTPGDS